VHHTLALRIAQERELAVRRQLEKGFSLRRFWRSTSCGAKGVSFSYSAISTFQQYDASG
jgi:hypothetical protein